MKTEDIIGSVAEYFENNPDSCLITWKGVAPLNDSFYRLNMVFVYVTFLYKGTVMARKIAGTTQRIDKTKKIIFSTDLLRAVNKQNSRKRVVMPADLYVGEDAYPAGLIKNVEYGSLPYQLSDVRSGDINILRVLRLMVESENKIATDRVVPPSFYLSAYEKEVYFPRPSGDLINILKSSSNFKPEDSLQRNFENCFEDCFTKLEDDRWLVNFNWVTGKGIPYMDLDSLFEVYEYKGSAEKLDYEDDNFIFHISGSLNR